MKAAPAYLTIVALFSSTIILSQKNSINQNNKESFANYSYQRTDNNLKKTKDSMSHFIPAVNKSVTSNLNSKKIENSYSGSKVTLDPIEKSVPRTTLDFF